MPHVDKHQLLDQIRKEIRKRHYSYRTEKQYVGWAHRYLQFNENTPPGQLGAREVESFLSYLATGRQVAAATQAQALAALLFLYKHVLRVDLPWIDNVTRARRPKRLPVVLTRAEVRRLLAELHGKYWVIASLLYGSGLRLLEALRLRVKDLDLDTRTLVVRDGKGMKDRVTLLPESLVSPLRVRLTRLREMHDAATEAGFGGVELPHALYRKYPRAHLDFGWQYLFPASTPTRDPRTGGWSRALTFARCRNCWVTAASRPRRSIRTSSIVAGLQHAARSTDYLIASLRSSISSFAFSSVSSTAMMSRRRRENDAIFSTVIDKSCMRPAWPTTR